MWGAADLDRTTLTVSMKARTAPRRGRPCRPKGWSWWKCNTKRPGESGSLKRPSNTGALRWGALAEAKSVRIRVMAATAIPIDTLPSINPATGQVLAHFEKTPPERVARAVLLARAAQKQWAKVPIRERCRRLRALREQRRYAKVRNAYRKAFSRSRIPSRPCGRGSGRGRGGTGGS